MLFSPFYQRKKLFERHKKALHPGESKALIYVKKKKTKSNDGTALWANPC